MGDDLDAFLRAKSTENGTLHDDASGSVDTPALEISVAERDRPQHLACVKGDGLRDVVLGDLVDCLRLDLRVGMLTVVLILGDDNVTGTLCCEDFRCALEE